MKKKVFIIACLIIFMMQLWGQSTVVKQDWGYELTHGFLKISITGKTKYYEEIEHGKFLFIPQTWYYDHFYVGNDVLSITAQSTKSNITIESNASFSISANDGISSKSIGYRITPTGGPSPADAAAAAAAGQTISGPSPSYEYFTLYFDKDLDGPSKPTVSFPNEKSNSWYNPDKKTIDFSLSGGADSGSGFDHYEYKISKNGSDSGYNTCSSSFTFSDKENGSYTISFYAVDFVGNRSEPVPYNINLDSTFPELDDSKQILGSAQNYVKNARINFTVTDDNLSSCEYRIYQNGVSNAAWKAVSVSNGMASFQDVYKTSGISTLEIKASDKAGNSLQKTYTVYVDSIPPQISVNSVTVTDSKEKTTTLSIDATADDDNRSGIYTFGTDPAVSEKYVNDPNDTVKQSVNEKFTSEVNRGETITNTKYKLEAQDICGNDSNLTVTFTKIPKRLVLSSFSSTIEGNNIVNKIKTNLSSKDEIDSYTLKYGRNFTVNDYDEIKDQLEKWNKEITVTKEQTVLEDGVLYILDKIPVSTGMGHHEVKYTFSCITKYSYKIGDGNETSKGFTDYLDTSALAENKCYCANNPCKITWKITGRDQGSDGLPGKQQSMEIDGSDSSIKDDNGQIYTNPNGTITISVRIEDLDFEKHDIQLYKYLYLSSDGDNENKTNLIKIPLERMIIEDYKTYDKTSGDYRSSGYYDFQFPVYLNYNKAENYGLEIVEYVDRKNTNQIVTKSGKVSLKADTPDLGGFKLNVLPNADYSVNGISLQVNTQLKMIIEELNDTGNSYIFDWGDKKASGTSEIKNGESASHVYGQKEGRTGAVSEYKLKIDKKENADSMPVSTEITVNAVDTQYGELAGDEVWIGTHKILSTITIPENRTLTINGTVPGTAGENEKVEIHLYGNPDNAEDGGGPTSINVKGTLKTENETDGIRFIEMHNDATYGFIANTSKIYGWGGIVAHPGAEIILSNVIIKFADRGVIALGESDVTILNSFIQNNDVGIHALENSKVTVNETEISNNVIYGIKEEKAGKDIVKLTDENNQNTNLIENNGSEEYPRNHYKATSGLEY